MSFLREHIENVQALALPDGVVEDGTWMAISRSALVTWHSAHTGMLHQAYVNGRFAGVTIDTEQRQLVVQTPVSLEVAVRVEVIAVNPCDAHVDFSGELEQPPVGSGRVKLTLLRSQALPLGAAVNVCSDHGTGEVQYDEPLNGTPIPIWPCLQDKAGLGMAQFGTGDFGYDSAAAVGFGKGSFGRGHFGLDADTITWISPPLPLGSYRFGVKVRDALGHESPATETETIAVIPAAKPVARLGVAAYQAQTNQLTLSISDQT